MRSDDIPGYYTTASLSVPSAALADMQSISPEVHTGPNTRSEDIDEYYTMETLGIDQKRSVMV